MNALVSGDAICHAFVTGRVKLYSYTASSVYSSTILLLFSFLCFLPVSKLLYTKEQKYCIRTLLESAHHVYCNDSGKNGHLGWYTGCQLTSL